MKAMELGIDLLDPEVPFRDKAEVCYRWGLCHAGKTEVPGTPMNIGVVRWLEDNDEAFKRWIDAGGRGDFEENTEAMDMHLKNQSCDRRGAIEATRAKKGSSSRSHEEAS